MIALADYLMKEVERAPKIIEEQLRRASGWPERVGGPGVATGAGDSYAAAIFTQFASGGEYVAIDPVHLLTARPGWVREVIAFSVKGRTIYVVRAAEALRRGGAVATAVTAVKDSPLAASSDRVLELVYAGGEHPVGVGNYVAELAAAWAYLGEGYGGVGVRAGDIKPIEVPGGGGEVVAVGEGAGFVNAVFLCLKLYEVGCYPCRYFEAEQFLHAPIYSLSSKSLVVLFESPSATRVSDVADVLRSAGVRHEIVPAGDGLLGTAVAGAIAAAKTSAYLASREGLTSPCFTSRSRLREASTPSIYG